jgi:hypothetical protein
LFDPLNIWMFEVRSFYNALRPSDSISFPWRSIWWSRAPLRVPFFAWTTVLGKILTMDNLSKRHIIMIDMCCMCKKSEKTVDHLLLHSKIASTLRNYIFHLFGIE